MSVTVHTENGPDRHHRATRWDVCEPGGLWLIAADRTIAEYAPGRWFAVTLDEDEVQDSDAEQESTDILSGALRVLNGRLTRDEAIDRLLASLSELQATLQNAKARS